MPKNEIKIRAFSTEFRKKAKDNAEDRTITFVASTGARDSAHTVLNQDNWDLTRFNANPIIGYQHEIYGAWSAGDVDFVIGKGHAYVEDKKLMVDITFEPKDINPLAEKIYQKILFGSINSVSVGFLPIGKGAWGKGEEGPGEARETYYYAGQQLLEISVVNIPANPEATKKGEDSAAAELEELRKQGAPATDPAPDAGKEAELKRNSILTIAAATLQL